MCLTGLEFFLLSVINFDALGMSGKWNFVNSSFPTFTFYLLFVLYSCVLLATYVNFFSIKKSKKGSQNYKFKDFKKGPITKAQKVSCIAFILAYYVIGTFFIGENYRLESGVLNKLIMTPLYGISYSFMLLYALNIEHQGRRYIKLGNIIFYVLFCLLLFSVTGAGGVITCFCILYLARLSMKEVSPIKLFFLFSLFTSSLIIFLIFVKYKIPINEVTEDPIGILFRMLGWIFERSLVVSGSSVFLIENFIYSRPSFGINDIIDIMSNNFSKLMGDKTSSANFRSLGEYNYTLFYKGPNINLNGVSPGVLGGSIYISLWFIAPLIASIFVFFILLLVSLSWSKYLSELSIISLFIFYYCIVHFFLYNPIAYLSIFDPSLIRFMIFLFTPILWDFLRRIKI